MNVRPLSILVLGTAFGLIGSLSASWASHASMNPTLKNIPENTWYKIGSNPEIPVGILAFSGMVYDDVNHKILLFGGGHADYWGNEVYQFDFSTLVWKKLYEPDPCSDYRTENYDDIGRPGMLIHTGRPFSRHSYDQMAFISHLNRLFVHSGFYLWNRDCMIDPRTIETSVLDDTWLFDPASLTWHYRSPTTGGPGPSLGTASAYDPITKKVYFLHGGSGARTLYAYTAETNTWQTVSENPSLVGHEYPMVYNSKNRSFDLVTSDGKVWRYYIDQNEWISKIPPQSISLDSQGLAYDRVHDLLIAYIQNFDGTDEKLLIYDWNTNQWIQPNPRTRPGARWPIWPHFIYDPIDSVFIAVIYGADGFETWAYKYKDAGSPPSPTDTVPPAAPTGLKVH
jgi:hypothetical protein